MESSKVCLKLVSMGGAEAVEIDEAFMLKQEVPHLLDVDFDDLEEKEVTILIGCDVAKAHWFMEQRASPALFKPAMFIYRELVLRGGLSSNKL
ncbi:unnamed protein product [Calicophoron daubneyi]|uniref:Uncharacterized protein n=1 Tax=Calicophoron daubneyi TaxID=300641 RepID=A0AAV2TXF6_CALDB